MTSIGETCLASWKPVTHGLSARNVLKLLRFRREVVGRDDVEVGLHQRGHDVRLHGELDELHRAVEILARLERDQRMDAVERALARPRRRGGEQVRIDVGIGGAQHDDRRVDAPGLGDAPVGGELHDRALRRALRHAGLVEPLPQLQALDRLRRIGERRLALGPLAVIGQAEVLELEPPLAAVGDVVGERDAELVRAVGQLRGGLDPAVLVGRRLEAGLVEQRLVVDEREVHIDRRQAVELAVLAQEIMAAARRDAERRRRPNRAARRA